MKLTCATGAVHPAAPNGGTIVSGGPFVASSIAKAGAMPTTTQTSRRSSSINEEVRPTQPNQTALSTIPTKAPLLQSPAFLSGNKKEVPWSKSKGGEDLANIRAWTARLKKSNREKPTVNLPAANTKPVSKERNAAVEDGSKESSKALLPESQQPVEKEASVVLQQPKKQSQMLKVSLIFALFLFPIIKKTHIELDLQSPAFLSGNKKEVPWSKSKGGEDLANIRAWTARLKKSNREKPTVNLPAANTKPVSKERNAAVEDGSKESSKALLPESQQPVEKEASVVLQQPKKQSQMLKVSLIFALFLLPIIKKDSH